MSIKGFTTSLVLAWSRACPKSLNTLQTYAFDIWELQPATMTKHKPCTQFTALYLSVGGMTCCFCGLYKQEHKASLPRSFVRVHEQALNTPQKPGSFSKTPSFSPPFGRVPTPKASQSPQPPGDGRVPSDQLCPRMTFPGDPTALCPPDINWSDLEISSTEAGKSAHASSSSSSGCFIISGTGTTWHPKPLL